MNHEQQARQLIAQLELISHAPTINLQPTSSHDSTRSRGGNRPPGGINRKDDLERGFALKSYDHFQRRIRRCHTDHGWARIAADAEAALNAWRHPTPAPKDSVPWQEQVAREKGSVRTVADAWGLSPARVHQLRQQYGITGRQAA